MESLGSVGSQEASGSQEAVGGRALRSPCVGRISLRGTGNTGHPVVDVDGCEDAQELGSRAASVSDLAVGECRRFCDCAWDGAARGPAANFPCFCSDPPDRVAASACPLPARVPVSRAQGDSRIRSYSFLYEKHCREEQRCPGARLTATGCCRSIAQTGLL